MRVQESVQYISGLIIQRHISPYSIGVRYLYKSSTPHPCDIKNANHHAVNGDDWDVPLTFAYSFSNAVDNISTPGAAISIQSP